MYPRLGSPTIPRSRVTLLLFACWLCACGTPAEPPTTAPPTTVALTVRPEPTPTTGDIPERSRPTTTFPVMPEPMFLLAIPRPSELPHQHPREVRHNVEQWRTLVAEYFDSGDVDRALCLMGHESGGNPDAKNPASSARGLMQIMASYWAGFFGVTYDDLYDPEINVRLAHEIYVIQGWRAWSPYQRGLCR